MAIVINNHGTKIENELNYNNYRKCLNWIRTNILADTKHTDYFNKNTIWVPFGGMDTTYRGYWGETMHHKPHCLIIGYGSGYGDRQHGISILTHGAYSMQEYRLSPNNTNDIFYMDGEDMCYCCFGDCFIESFLLHWKEIKADIIKELSDLDKKIKTLESFEV